MIISYFFFLLSFWFCLILIMLTLVNLKYPFLRILSHCVIFHSLINIYTCIEHSSKQADRGESLVGNGLCVTRERNSSINDLRPMAYTLLDPTQSISFTFYLTSFSRLIVRIFPHHFSCFFVCSARFCALELHFLFSFRISNLEPIDFVFTYWFVLFSSSVTFYQINKCVQKFNIHVSLPTCSKILITLYFEKRNSDIRIFASTKTTEGTNNFGISRFHLWLNRFIFRMYIFWRCHKICIYFFFFTLQLYMNDLIQQQILQFCLNGMTSWWLALQIYYELHAIRSNVSLRFWIEEGAHQDAPLIPIPIWSNHYSRTSLSKNNFFFCYSDH